MGPGYDIIGDIHGYAEPLEVLLGAMGYKKRDGVWCHAERVALFVGDFVDRGPENLRACRIAMAMMEAHSALAVMGNHDFNAICLATHDPDDAGGFLRPHTEKNLRQAAATTAEIHQAPDEAAAVLAWMRRLPLWIERDGLRLVHAGWSRHAIAALAPFVDADGALTDAGLVRAARKGDPVRHAREILLNGMEADLPPGISYFDRDGNLRKSARIAWWRAGNSAMTWRDMVHVGESVRAQLPEGPVTDGLPDLRDAREAADPNGTPVFFGHYWMNSPLAPQSPTHVCVDASIAKGGKLAAYRYSREPELGAERFVYA